jgi:hypothetical protein
VKSKTAHQNNILPIHQNHIHACLQVHLMPATTFCISIFKPDFKIVNVNSLFALIPGVNFDLLFGIQWFAEIETGIKR